MYLHLVSVCAEGSGGATQIRTLPPWVVPVPWDQWWPGAASVGRRHISVVKEGWPVHYLPLLPRPVPPDLTARDGAAEKLDPQETFPNHILLTHSTFFFFHRIWSFVNEWLSVNVTCACSFHFICNSGRPCTPRSHVQTIPTAWSTCIFPACRVSSWLFQQLRLKSVNML